MIGQTDHIRPLISADRYPGWHIYSLWKLLFQFHGQLALKSDWDNTCFSLACIDSVDIQITLKLHSKYSIPHAQVSLLDDCAGGLQGVQLLDRSNQGQVQAIRQLDSSEYGTVDTPAFKAEACELANLLARNWTCQLQRNYTGPWSSSTEDAFRF